MKATNALSLAIAAGCIASPAMANNTPVQKQGTMPTNVIGHIYFNVVTGEKIATALGDGFRPADAVVGHESWIADDGLPCAAFGQLTGTAVVMDAPNGEFGFATVEGDTMLDWGDIPADTVIDALQLDYFSTIQDVDTDSDGIGDGVEGYAGVWTFNDADNGFNDCLGRTGLIGFTIMNLSGQLGGPGSFGGYLFTLDLAVDFGSSATFELGDTDSDLQGASVHNPMGFMDSDSDLNHDFSYTATTIQPGRIDIDNADGDSDTTTGIDGDPLADGLTAVGLSAPFGSMADNGDGTWTFTPDAGINATGAEDAFDIFDATGFYTGTFWMGGVDCGDGVTGPYRAYSQMDLIMYSPPSGCAGDYNGDGNLNIFDVFAYLDDFNSGTMAGDYNGDGTLNIFDFFAFLDDFNAGCP